MLTCSHCQKRISDGFILKTNGNQSFYFHEKCHAQLYPEFYLKEEWPDTGDNCEL